MKTAEITDIGPIKDIQGQVFGSWTVLRYVGRKKWLCRCVCDQERAVLGASLRNGASTSCGCTRMVKMQAANTSHGMAHSPEYKVWRSMIDRCRNPRNNASKNYGGRGIDVCARWAESFEAFISDMGPRPSARHTVERIDNDLGYGPSNCRWATRFEQSRNMRSNIFLTIDGERMILTDACRKVGLKRATVESRIREGWSAEEAISCPVNSRYRSRGNVAKTS